MKILIVVDMQKDFISGPLGTAEARAIVPYVAEKAKNTPRENLFVTLDTHQPNYMETNEGRHLPVPHCIEGTEGHALDNAIAAAVDGIPASRIIRKPTFGSVALTDMLRALPEPPTKIEFVGVCTGICVISNAMLCKAAFPEANIVIDAALCACVTPESHDTALNAMRLCQMEILHQGEEPWRK